MSKNAEKYKPWAKHNMPMPVNFEAEYQELAAAVRDLLLAAGVIDSNSDLSKKHILLALNEFKKSLPNEGTDTIKLVATMEHGNVTMIEGNQTVQLAVMDDNLDGADPRSIHAFQLKSQGQADVWREYRVYQPNSFRDNERVNDVFGATGTPPVDFPMPRDM